MEVETILYLITTAFQGLVICAIGECRFPVVGLCLPSWQVQKYFASDFDLAARDLSQQQIPHGRVF